MKKIVYTSTVLDPNSSLTDLSEDIKDPLIEKIIIPSFTLKTLNIKYSRKGFPNLVKLLEQSDKIEIIDFPVMYNNVYETSYFILFMEYLVNVKKYKDLYIKSDCNPESIEYIKRGYKIYISEDRSQLFRNMNKENYVFPKSKVAFIDTCYYINMFESFHIGLNLMLDSCIKKIILSCVLEELLNIKRLETFKFLIYFLNNKEKYNIEFINSAKAYSETFGCNDLAMLSDILRFKNKITIYTYDSEFAMQCMALGIKTSSSTLPPLSSGPKANNALNNENLNESKMEQIVDTIDLKEEDSSNEKSATNNIGVGITESKVDPKKLIEVPIIVRKNQIYISSKYVEAVFSNITSRMYSNVAYSVKKEPIFLIRHGRYAKLPESDLAYQIIKIDTHSMRALLSRTTLKL